MMSRAEQTRALAIAALLIGCSTESATYERVSQVTAALEVCGDSTPVATVDGIPAYAQCDASADTAIWSNNGVDTSATSLGADWVRTQFGGGYQCTELVWRYNHFKWGVDYRNQDAKTWCDGELPASLTTATTPTHGDAIVFDGGVCGADATTGHIALVDEVNDEETVTIVEQNRASRRAVKQSCALCYLHVIANNGTGNADAAASVATEDNPSTSSATAATSDSASTASTAESTSASEDTESSKDLSTSSAPSSVPSTSTNEDTQSSTSEPVPTANAESTGNTDVMQTGLPPATTQAVPDSSAPPLLAESKPVHDVNACAFSARKSRRSATGSLVALGMAVALLGQRRRLGSVNRCAQHDSQ